MGAAQKRQSKYPISTWKDAPRYHLSSGNRETQIKNHEVDLLEHAYHEREGKWMNLFENCSAASFKQKHTLTLSVAIT